MITYLGSLSIGAAVPGAAALAAAGQAGINLALPDIQARLAALVQFTPQPVDFQAQLILAQQIVASIEAAIALGLAPPSIDAQLAIVAALVAELEAAIANVHAQLTIIVDIAALLGTAGVHAYAYSGRADDLGGEFAAELVGGFPGGGPTDSTNALLLATTSGATWTAMQGVFKTTP